MLISSETKSNYKCRYIIAQMTSFTKVLTSLSPFLPKHQAEKNYTISHKALQIYIVFCKISLFEVSRNQLNSALSLQCYEFLEEVWQWLEKYFVLVPQLTQLKHS